MLVDSRSCAFKPGPNRSAIRTGHTVNEQQGAVVLLDCDRAAAVGSGIVHVRVWMKNVQCKRAGTHGSKTYPSRTECLKQLPTVV
jgi:hypothetical protein